MFIDLTGDYNRARILFVTESVTISPNKTFEFSFLGKIYRFVQGEESTVPRWLAEILKARGLATIKGDIDQEEIVSNAMQILIAEGKTPNLTDAGELIIRLKDFLYKENNPTVRKNILAILKKLTDIRSLKLLKLATKGEIEKSEINNLDPLERILFTWMSKIYKTWQRIILDASNN